MVVTRIETDVPENRQVLLTLPPEFPVGRVELVVAVNDSADAFRVSFDPSQIRRVYPVRPSHPKLAQEFDAFQRLLPDLLGTHRNQFVAIHEGQVVASGADQVSVAQQAYARCGYQAIYVAQVTDQPQPVIRSGLVRELPAGPRP